MTLNILPLIERPTSGKLEISFCLSLRIIFWLMASHIGCPHINAYSGTLTSRMSVPKTKPIPQYLKELGYSIKEYRVTMMENY